MNISLRSAFIKCSLWAAFLFALIPAAHAQKYLDKIGHDACDCISKLPDTGSAQSQTIAFGVCVLDAARPYKKKIKRDMKIDMDKSDFSGEQLGVEVALKMAHYCPDLLMRITQNIKTKKEQNINESDMDDRTVRGTITKVDDGMFVVFSLKDDDGQILKFYWLSDVESSLDLPNVYYTLINKEVVITYEEKKLFDPKVEEYRRFNVIKKIEAAGR